MAAVGPSMQAFFTERLASPHTVADYRDSLRLPGGHAATIGRVLAIPPRNATAAYPRR